MITSKRVSEALLQFHKFIAKIDQNHIQLEVKQDILDRLEQLASIEEDERNCIEKRHRIEVVRINSENSKNIKERMEGIDRVVRRLGEYFRTIQDKYKHQVEISERSLRLMQEIMNSGSGKEEFRSQIASILTINKRSIGRDDNYSYRNSSILSSIKKNSSVIENAKKPPLPPSPSSPESMKNPSNLNFKKKTPPQTALKANQSSGSSYADFTLPSGSGGKFVEERPSMLEGSLSSFSSPSPSLQNIGLSSLLLARSTAISLLSESLN